MTNYRRRLDLARKTLCLSCCTEMEHGYCQACWEQQSRAAKAPATPASPTFAHRCPACGGCRVSIYCCFTTCECDEKDG